MNSFDKDIDRLAVNLTRGVLRFRWPVIALAVITGVLIGTGAARIEFLNNYRVFFSEQNPELVAFEDLQATYTKTTTSCSCSNRQTATCSQPRLLRPSSS